MTPLISLLIRIPCAVVSVVVIIRLLGFQFSQFNLVVVDHFLKSLKGSYKFIVKVFLASRLILYAYNLNFF